MYYVEGLGDLKAIVDEFNAISLKKHHWGKLISGIMSQVMRRSKIFGNDWNR